MRWSEIIKEELGTVQLAKSSIMDILAPLKAQGVKSITVQQILDQLRGNPDFEGIELEGGLVNSALQGVKDVKIEPDSQDGGMTVFINSPLAGRQVDAKQAERDDKKIRAAAMRSIDRKEPK